MSTFREQQTRLPNTRTLITGFGPFGTFDVNPSSQLAAGCGRPFQILEVSYAAVDRFLAEVSADAIDLLVMLGVAGSSQRMRLETIARNSVGVTPDVRGVIAGPSTIDPDAPQVIPLSFSIELPNTDRWEQSTDAGDYLCNYLFFQAIRRLSDTRAIFVHVPPFEVLAEEIQTVELHSILARIERV